MAGPSTPGWEAPPGEDWMGRKVNDLERQIRELGPSIAASFAPVIADLQAQQATLTTQAAYQASLISRDASTATFNTGTMTNDSAWHLVGGQAVITGLAIPTGKVRITISVSEASISPGTNSVLAAICYAIDGISTLDPTARYARLYTSTQIIGSSLARIEVATPPPGTYTIRAQCAYWSAGTGTASANFTSPRLLAEVIGSD